MHSVLDNGNVFAICIKLAKSSKFLFIMEHVWCQLTYIPFCHNLLLLTFCVEASCPGIGYKRRDTGHVITFSFFHIHGILMNS